VGVEFGRIVHVNADGEQVGFIDEFGYFDCVTSLDLDYENNSWVLSLGREQFNAYGIAEDHRIIIPGTEYGGRVKRIRSVNNGQTVELEGAGVRGMMARWIIKPPAGEGYYILPETEANAALALIAGGRLVDYYEVSAEDSGFVMDGVFRYNSVYEALVASIYTISGARLNVAYDDAGIAHLSFVPVTDYSAQIDFSQDYGAPLTADVDYVSRYNGIVALGKGELADRDVVIYYLWRDGTLHSDPESLNDVREYLYDDNSVESLADLAAKAAIKLREVGDRNTIKIDLSGLDIELQLGDIVGARDRVTGLTIKDSVYTKILRIENGITTLQYTMKGDAAQ